MTDDRQCMLALLGVAPDPAMLDGDLSNLPATEQPRERTVSRRRHDQLVAAGSALTGASLIGGAALVLWAGWRLLFAAGGGLDVVLAVTGLVLVATHWGWVHLAEYAGLTLDARHARECDAQQAQWLATIQPYPRFSVETSVDADATTHIQRFLHRPLLTADSTFRFVREADIEHVHAVDAPAEVIALDVETMRRQARLQTDRMRELWEAAATAYFAALLSDDDDQARLSAQRAAAIALSEHINASLREAPVVD